MLPFAVRILRSSTLLLLFVALDNWLAASRSTADDFVFRSVVIEAASAQIPRSDTASICELSNDRLMVVYHRYESGREAGNDHGVCRIWSRVSEDKGQTWQQPRMLVDVAEGDMNVQAPGVLRLKSGRILLNCLRAHGDGSSSTMCLFASDDQGRSFQQLPSLWKRSSGQLLQGGASSLLQLESGRLLLPFHGGDGNQWKQKNSAWCLFSDDDGASWARSNSIELPKRGAMEGSAAQLQDGTLLMSLRTQLGGPWLSRSSDQGTTWTPAWFSGLEGGESCTCLRRIPGTDILLLLFNNSKFEPRHHHLGERTPLTVALSRDGGNSWSVAGDLLEDPQAEYTNLDCCFTSAGDAIVTFLYAKPAWNRNAIDLRAVTIPKTWLHDAAGRLDSGGKSGGQ